MVEAKLQTYRTVRYTNDSNAVPCSLLRLAFLVDFLNFLTFLFFNLSRNFSFSFFQIPIRRDAPVPPFKFRSKFLIELDASFRTLDLRYASATVTNEVNSTRS